MATRTTPGILSTADGLKYLPRDRESAFFGLLQANVDLTRSLEQALQQRHGISLAGYEVLNRLAHAEEHQLRMTNLAERTPLSLSRISRVCDDLALRGYVERRACASDRRVAYATLLPQGLAFLRDAQETFYATVEERFLGLLSPEETKVLADVFLRLTGGDGACRTNLG
jgi:DNA-binding MarR family transcriptional regulator